jgi:hypothetical protein
MFKPSTLLMLGKTMNSSPVVIRARLHALIRKDNKKCSILSM